MEKLGKYEIIVECPETKKDVIATIVESTLGSGQPAARINGTNNIVMTNARTILEKNTPENVKKVLKELKK